MSKGFAIFGLVSSSCVFVLSMLGLIQAASLSAGPNYSVERLTANVET